MGAPVAFFEVISADVERARTFYSELFGWQVASDSDMGGYALVDTRRTRGRDRRRNRAIRGAGDAGVRIYMRVDDLDAFLDQAERLGGAGSCRRLTCPASSAIRHPGRPDGNVVGLWS